jgi:hypothetical protein
MLAEVELGITGERQRTGIGAAKAKGVYWAGLSPSITPKSLL